MDMVNLEFPGGFIGEKGSFKKGVPTVLPERLGLQ